MSVAAIRAGALRVVRNVVEHAANRSTPRKRWDQRTSVPSLDQVGVRGQTYMRSLAATDRLRVRRVQPKQLRI